MTSASEKACCSNVSASALVPLPVLVPLPLSDSPVAVVSLRPQQILSFVLFLLSIMVGLVLKPPSCAGSYAGRLRSLLWTPLSRAWKRIWYCLLLHFIGVKWGLMELLQTHRTFDIDGIPKRPGHVVVVTGGARGIGVHVVRKLLQCEMHVIIGCRSPAAGQRVLNELRSRGLRSGTSDVLELDLESLASVRAFAASILARPTPVHVLINNAGIMFVPHKLTEPDGLESHLQVNYVSHYLLTMLLLPRMRATAAAAGAEYKGRIVNVSSCAHYGGQVDLRDLSMKEFYSPYMGYMTSKFLQTLTSNALSVKLRRSESRVLAVAVHPGIVQTELYRHVWWFNALRFVTRLLFKTPEQGADTILYATLSPDLETEPETSGASPQFIANCTRYAPKPDTNSVALQEAVLQITNRLIGLKADADTEPFFCNNNAIE